MDEADLAAVRAGLGAALRYRAAEAPRLVFVERLPNPAGFDDVDPERALKVLVYARD